jgi:methionyl-tRNA formyltransferase
VQKWAIINGEKETGVTLFLINDSGVDSGKIIMQKRIPVLTEDYASDVYEKATECTIDICLEFFENYRNNKKYRF